MRDFLAERLLASVMEWSPEDIAQERPYLQAMAAYKYDSYSQFRPGMRFIESLALWLEQFELLEERRMLYTWLKERLVFISSSEVSQLVALSFPQVVRPRLIARCSKILNIREVHIAKIAQTPEYRSLLRQTLFLGLSDGAQLSTFRRFNIDVSHEQVWLTYDFTEEKAENMAEELRKDLSDIPAASPIAPYFREVFLMDDFSASGLSYIRTEDGEYKGKIHKALEGLRRYKEFFELSDLGVTVILYVATEQAIEHLRSTLRSYPSEASVDVQVIQLLHQDQCIREEDHIVPILKKYFDPIIVDRHYRKGRHERPYLGFDEGGLSCILGHNTPNNSLPLLWFDERCRFRGIFPRVSRHKS